MQLTDLPPELLIQTLSLLSPEDLLSCQLTCTFLNSIVHNSIVLQYGAALLASGSVDNPCSALPLSSKLEALKAAERAWARLSPRFTKKVKVSGNQCGVYDLTGGVYLLSNAARKELMYLRLPTTKQEAKEAQWRVLPLKKTIIDIGLCLFEHDLLVIISTTPSPLSTASQPLFDIEMQYLQFSTGLPHPLAAHKNTHVMSSPWEKPAVGIEIVGEHLVLILTFISRGRTDDRVFIYEWMSDVVKVSFLAPHRSYSGLIFLTPSLILLPNTNTNAFDIFRIPDKPTLSIPQPVLVLKLPELAEERVMGGITCRAEPNPVGDGWWASERARSSARAGASATVDAGATLDLDSGLSSSSSASTYESKAKENEKAKTKENPTTTTTTTTTTSTTTASLPTRAALPPPASAICLFELRILALRLHMHQGAWNMGLEFRDRFAFVVRREGFVRLVEKCGEFELGEAEEERQEEEEEEAAAAEVPAAQAGAGAGAGAGTQGDASASTPTPTPMQAQTPTQQQQRTPPTLPYSAWAPDITRWFNSERMSSRWITVSAGERLVRMEDKLVEGVGQIGIRRRQRRAEAGGVDEEDDDNDDDDDEESDEDKDEDEDEDEDEEPFKRPFTVVDFRPEFVERVGKVYDAAEAAAEAEAEAEAKRKQEEDAAKGAKAQGAEAAEAVRVEDEEEAEEEAEVARREEDKGKSKSKGKGKGKGKQGQQGEEDQEVDGASRPMPMQWMRVRVDHDDDEEEEMGHYRHQHHHHNHNQEETSSARQRRRRGAPDADADVDVDEDEDVTVDVDMASEDIDVFMDAEEGDSDEGEEAADYAIIVDEDNYLPDDDDDEFEDYEDGEGEWTDAEDDDGGGGGEPMLHTGLAMVDPFPVPSSSSHLLPSSSYPPPKPPVHPIPRTRLVRSCDRVEPGDAFAERVEGALPYVEIESAGEWGFDGVLMDEERVVGVYTNEDDRIEQVEILYFG